MNLILEGLFFCNPFLKRKQDENLQTNSKTQGSYKDMESKKKSSLKARPNHPIETDSDSSIEPKQKIYFKDDNFLILHPDYVTYSREEDEASVHSNVKTFPFSVHKKSNVCDILDNEPDFEEIMARICKKRLMSGEECECSRCRTLNVIKESLKHPGSFSWGNKYPDNVKTNRSDLQNAKKSIKHDAALLRIEIALHSLMEKLANLEKLAESKNDTKFQSDFCSTCTQYSSPAINVDDSSIQQRCSSKIPNYKYKNNELPSEYCHKTWALKQNNTEGKQQVTFLPRVKEENLDISHTDSFKLPRAVKRKYKPIEEQ